MISEGAYLTHIRNGMRWVCGPATMTADSAIQNDREGRVVMIRSVHYRDTLRDLTSGRLTYFRGEDRVVAEDSAVLTRIRTGAVLTGPRMQFHNALTGGPDRTVATGRPHAVIPPSEDEGGDPFHLDGDSLALYGGARADAVGDVVARHADTRGTGARGEFDFEGGTGLLTGEPALEGPRFRLTGDSIRLVTERRELREVAARGSGHLVGDEVDVRGDRIRVRVEDREVEELWASGPGGAVAVSAEQEIRGDSLHFSFAAGRLTGVTAVGEALAVERGGEDPVPTRDAGPADSIPGAAPARDTLTPPVGDTLGRPAGEGPVPPPGASPPHPGTDRSWIAGDTVQADFVEPDSTAAGEDASRARVRRLTARGRARSFYLAPPDTAGPTGEVGGRLRRNYLIGRTIEVLFDAGEPWRVSGEEAIGIFLEPTPTSGAPADTVGRRQGRDAAPPDTADAAGTRERRSGIGKSGWHDL